MSNYLIIVEGEKDEKRILENAFVRYGFGIKTINKKLDINSNQFDKSELSLNKDNVVLIQGPSNRVHELLIKFNQNEEDFEKYFNYHSKYFQGIFLLYDVDHNSNDDIEILMNKFNDEFTGMLLLSSPCIEVIGDFNRNRKENKWTHLKEYKKELNIYYKHGVIDEIIKNFDKYILHFIKKNKEELKSNNVMEHPSLLVKKINEMNIRYNDKIKENSYVIYRYFSTVIYVLIAHCHKLTKEINNVDNVIDFFENKSKF